jgi:hypothetical protein
MSKDYAKHKAGQRAQKKAQRKYYWLVVVVLVAVFVLINYISVKEKRTKLHLKEAVTKTAAASANKSADDSVQFSFQQKSST